MAVTRDCPVVRLDGGCRGLPLARHSENLAVRCPQRRLPFLERHPDDTRDLLHGEAICSNWRICLRLGNVAYWPRRRAAACRKRGSRRAQTGADDGRRGSKAQQQPTRRAPISPSSSASPCSACAALSAVAGPGPATLRERRDCCSCLERAALERYSAQACRPDRTCGVCCRASVWVACSSPLSSPLQPQSHHAR